MSLSGRIFSRRNPPGYIAACAAVHAASTAMPRIRLATRTVAPDTRLGPSAPLTWMPPSPRRLAPIAPMEPSPPDQTLTGRMAIEAPVGKFHHTRRKTLAHPGRTSEGPHGPDMGLA